MSRIPIWASVILMPLAYLLRSSSAFAVSPAAVVEEMNLRSGIVGGRFRYLESGRNSALKFGRLPPLRYPMVAQLVLGRSLSPVLLPVPAEATRQQGCYPLPLVSWQISGPSSRTGAATATRSQSTSSPAGRGRTFPRMPDRGDDKPARVVFRDFHLPGCFVGRCGRPAPSGRSPTRRAGGAALPRGIGHAGRRPNAVRRNRPCRLEWLTTLKSPVSPEVVHLGATRITKLHAWQYSPVLGLGLRPRREERRRRPSCPGGQTGCPPLPRHLQLRCRRLHLGRRLPPTAARESSSLGGAVGILRLRGPPPEHHQARRDEQ